MTEVGKFHAIAVSTLLSPTIHGQKYTASSLDIRLRSILDDLAER